MATGEGKTLVATLPLYLNALTGRGAHLVTVNDYLARRDAEWMGAALQISRPHRRLSFSTISRRMIRREQYAMDITYGTNSEFGFDYLRDNGMATTREQQVQRGYNYAIVDEVDSILIDEARTPLIISGPATVSTHQYDKWKPLVDQLVRKQNMLCNRLASEAKEAFDKDEVEEGGLLMFKVKLGQPRNKQLLRMMEDPEKRKAIDKAELPFYQDTRKEELFALKEELFFTIDEKSHEADLSEQGRAFLNPDDPDSFVLPDLISEFTEIDLDPALSDEEKDKAENRAPAALRRAGRADSQHLAIAARLLPFRERRAVRRSRKTKSSSSTNTPAAKCRAAAGAMACTRRSKRRKACRSIARRRRSPRSRSKIISGFTTSSPA